MPTKLLLALLLALCPRPANTAPRWTDNIQTASSQAQSEGKQVLVVFTGSDWCHWCQKLERELFAGDTLQNELPSLVVPVRIDFPQRRRLTPKQRRYNLQQKAAYEVTSFPTVILIDPSSGKELLRHGYTSTPTQAYLSRLRIICQQGKPDTQPLALP